MTWQAARPALVLASASATRRALLDAAGIAHEAVAPMVDEAEVKRQARAEGYTADDAAMLLADLKARRVAGGRPDALVIGCDQLLVCEDRWFDKPATPADARTQLQALRGRPHTLVTAALCHRDGCRVWQHVVRPRLVMRAFSDAFLDEYLRREGTAVTQSVGGYRIEGLGIQLFESVAGEHAAILGLPLLPLLEFLRQHGVLADGESPR